MEGNLFTNAELDTLISLPLVEKIAISKQKLHDFVERIGIDNVYLSFSGGKDSTVMAYLALEEYPGIKMLFVNTGLEFPEIVQFVKDKRDKEGWDIDIVKPKMRFAKVIEKYGYPIISKEQSSYIEEWRNAKSERVKDIRWNGGASGGFKIAEKWKGIAEANNFKITSKCCNVMKKAPSKKYLKDTGRHPIIGTMAMESRLRRQQFLKLGCTSWDGKIQHKPLSIWTEQDVLDYVDMFGIVLAPPYAMGYQRTGCTFCAFGCHIEEKETGTNRFVRLEQTHPKLHRVVMEKLGFRDVLGEYGVMRDLVDYNKVHEDSILIDKILKDPVFTGRGDK